MANNPQQHAPSKHMTISSLLSPPEMQRSESFGSLTPSATMSSQSSATPKYGRPIQASQLESRHGIAAFALASPPISPYTSIQENDMDKMDVDGADGVLDPPLFRRDHTSGSIDVHEPLFPQEQVDPASMDVINKHMKSDRYARLEDPPTLDEYKLAATLVSNVHGEYVKNPRLWFLQERQFDQQINDKKTGAHKKQPLKQLAPAPSAKSQGKLPKVGIPRLQRSPRAPRVQKPTPKAQIHTHNSFADAALSSASPKLARPAGNRDDTDFGSLPDYSPPLSTLGAGNVNALKTEWKGSALKLHDDPDRHMLHEAEIQLAGTLRLSCATYLCSKRRIFQARVEALKIGKEFRKTDAQQACKIDVNKASKLWSVYDKVGWFDPKHFVHWT